MYTGNHRTVLHTLNQTAIYQQTFIQNRQFFYHHNSRLRIINYLRQKEEVLIWTSPTSVLSSIQHTVACKVIHLFLGG